MAPVSPVADNPNLPWGKLMEVLWLVSSVMIKMVM